MPNNTAAKSIAEVLAEAEKQKIESAKRAAQEYAQRRQAEAQAVAAGVTEARKIMSGAAMGGKAPAPASKKGGASAGAGKGQPAAAPAPAKKADDLLDEFDIALEAVQTAKKSLGNDTVAIEKMAVNIVMAKTGLSRDEAPRYVRKAINYLNG
jgi:hypothetical protein